MGIVAIFFIIAINIFAGTVHLVQRYTGDDSYFYLVIARNTANGIYSSFDGIHYTNGYHPLWMVPLSALAVLFRGVDGFLRAAIGLGVLLNGLALYIIWKKFHRYFIDASTGHIVIGIAAFFLLLPSWFCMESPLAILLAIVAISYFLNHYDSIDIRTNIFIGLLFALVVLSRLDTIFCIAPLFLVRLSLLDRSNRLHIRSFLIASAVFSLVIIAYVATNVMATGHMMPISGAIKSSFPRPTITNMPFRLGRLIRIIPPVFSAVFVLVLLFFRRTWSTVPRHVVATFIGLNAGVVLFSTYEFLFQKSAAFGLRPWHFAVPSLIMALSLGLFVIQIAPRRFRYIIAGVILVVNIAAAAQKYGTRHIRTSSSYDIYQMAEWIRENVPEGDVIAATDSGALAYFGLRKTINLDGLVNSFEYQRIVADGKLKDYLRDNDVRYVAILGRGANPERDMNRIPIEARLYNSTTYLEFTRQELVYVSPHKIYMMWKSAF